MPTYVILNKLTDQGAKAIRESPKRSIAAQEVAKKLGGKITFYYIFGEYITMGLLEVPTDDAAVAFVTKLQSLGNVTTVLSKAYSIEEAEKKMGS